MSSVPCRLHRLPVPTLASGDASCGVDAALRDQHLRPRWLYGVQEAGRLRSAEGPCLVQLIPGDESRVRALQSLRPDLPLILLLPHAGAGCGLDVVPGAQVYVLGGPSVELAGAVVALRLGMWMDKLAGETTGASSTSPRIRQALLAIMGRRQLPDSVSSDQKPLRSLTDMANVLAITPKTLSRSAAGSRADLLFFAEAWAALLSLAARCVERRKWEPIARQNGYADVSGVSKLMERALGRDLRYLSGAGLEEGLIAVETTLGRLLTPPGARSSGA